MIKRQKLIGIIASVVLAGIGTGLLVAYVRGAEHRALKGDKPVKVLVVSDTIPKGTKVEDIVDKVKQQEVPSKVVATGALSSLTPIAGQVAVVDLVPGEQVVSTRFAAAGDTSRLGVPAGMLQVTVALDAVRAVGGIVREGDTVGVLASFDDPETTHLILHKVQVTGVRSADAGTTVKTKTTDAVPTGKLFVTLALDSPSVEKVVFAAEHGRLWLSEEPKDANEGGTKVQNKQAVNL